MRTFPTDVAAHLAAQAGLNARLLVWLSARNRGTGATETVGLWTGAQDRTFTIDAVARAYHGAGGLVSMAPIVSEIGLTVRQHRLQVSPVAPEVAQGLREYDARLAPVEIHVAYFQPGSDVMIGIPVRVFRGWIDTVTITVPEVGGEAAAEIVVSSAAQALTRGLALKKSDGSLRRRAPADGFRRYADVSGSVETVWGEARAAAPAGAAPPAAPAPSEVPSLSDSYESRR